MENADHWECERILLEGGYDVTTQHDFSHERLR